MTYKEKIKSIVSNLPDSPGVYQYFDESSKIIYVGKAKNLKKRVSSYFNREVHENNKTRVLVSNIRNIQFIVVDTEYDALLLESNLIKKYQPRYNINLKDDKTYPWICITNEPFPRIITTRKVIKNGSTYFGPYAVVPMMYNLLNLLKDLFPIRTCQLNLSQANISANKFKVCLEYHIKNCKGPCEALQTAEDYNRNILQAKEIIKGNNFSVIKMLKENMQSCADKYEFEKAQWYKSKIEKLERYSVKSSVVSSIISNLDVVTIVEDAQACYVNFMRIINGAVNLSDSFEIKKKLDENLQEIVSYALVYIQEKFSFLYPEVISNVLPELDFPGCEFLVPQRGDKKKLLDLSQKNALQFCKDKQKQLEATDPENHVKRIMQQMQKDLRLTEEPRHIECFDNSNFQGDFAVSAMTVFKDGKPSKKDYRHFNVKTVVGPDDFATMEEVIFRRYKRVLEENESLPQLIVIDGGKGQLSAACKSLEQLNLLGKVGIIGIAKRLEEIYYPGDSIPMYLDKRCESLKIIQQIRDEAHRFGITHHRNRRDKGTLKTELSSIKGISEKTSEKLLTEFKSVKRIKELSLEELTQSIGAAKAKLIFEYFTLKET